jgi:hypothetical protein
VPPRFGAVRCMLRNFAPRPQDEDFFAERMTVRVCNPGAQSTNAYSPRAKTVHRADPEVVVSPGANRAFGSRLVPLRGWHPIDALHFPIRSLRQCEQKYLRWWELFGRVSNSVWTVAHDAHSDGRMREFYESYVVDDEALAKGLGDGTLAVDTRLRDALRALRAKSPRGLLEFGVPPRAQRLSFPDSTIDEAYLSELGRLMDADPVVVAQRRVDALEARLAALDRSLSSRIRELSGHG